MRSSLRNVSLFYTSFLERPVTAIHSLPYTLDQCTVFPHAVPRGADHPAFRDANVLSGISQQSPLVGRKAINHGGASRTRVSGHGIHGSLERPGGICRQAIQRMYQGCHYGQTGTPVFVIIGLHVYTESPHGSRPGGATPAGPRSLPNFIEYCSPTRAESRSI